LKERLLANPQDAEASAFFAVLRPVRAGVRRSRPSP